MITFNSINKNGMQWSWKFKDFCELLDRYDAKGEILPHNLNIISDIHVDKRTCIDKEVSAFALTLHKNDATIRFEDLIKYIQNQLIGYGIVLDKDIELASKKTES